MDSRPEKRALLPSPNAVIHRNDKTKPKMGPKKRPKTILESRIEREKRNADAGNEDYGDPMEIDVPKEKDVPKVYLPNTDKVGPVQSSFSPHSTASSATASPTHKNLPPIAVPSPQLTSNGKPIEHICTYYPKQKY